MNICFFNTSRSWGGGEKWHLELAEYMQNKGENCYLVVLEDSVLYKKALNKKLNIFPFKINNFSFLNIVKLNRIKRYFLNNSIDAVIINSPKDLKIAGIAGKLANIEKIIYRRGSAIPIKNTFFNRYLFNKIITHIIANSEETKKSILANNPNLFPNERIEVIYNGLNVSEYINCEKNLNQVITIGTAGRLSKEKNFDSLIRVCKLVLQSGYDVELIIAGVGSEDKYLRTISDSLGISSKVAFIDFVEDINIFMRQIDIFASTSKWEGFGYVRLEAMLNCLPVIAYDNSSTKELIIDEFNGFLIEEGNEEEFAKKIIELINNRDKIIEMGKNGKEFAMKFDIKNTVNSLYTLLNDI